MSIRHAVRPHCFKTFPPTVVRPALSLSFWTMSSELDPRISRVTGSSPLSNADAKWVSLRKIEWVDPTGKQRAWESADRTTRNGVVDGK